MFMHWLVALLLIMQFAFGWYLNEIPRGIPERSFFVNMHKSSGIAIGLLIAFRLAWRLIHTPPPLPDSMPRWQRSFSAFSHGLLYALMLIMPLSGYIASNFSKWGVKFLNAYTFAPWGFESKPIYDFFNQVHKISSWLLLGMVIVHVLAALKHVFIDRDHVFTRMAPRITRGGASTPSA
jgi:cytochrome b561